MKPRYRHEFRHELNYIARWVRSIIRRSRCTQVAFARDIVKVSHSTLMHWLAKETLPSLHNRKRLKEIDDQLSATMSDEDKQRLDARDRIASPDAVGTGVAK